MNRLVLIVDDEDRTREMLRLLLEFKGYAVHEAVDGLDALQKVAQQQPDVMILDVMMPNMDGIKVCKKLRSEPATADLPIIMLSGKSHPDAIEEGMQAGATKYMRKPMSPQDLLDNIRNVLLNVPTSVHA